MISMPALVRAMVTATVAVGSFFGTMRKGRRVVYLVDFSGSMGSDASGGTRIALLKKELVRSINELDARMNFAVIFFSHHAWTIDIDNADAGWNGLGDDADRLLVPGGYRGAAEVYFTDRVDGAAGQHGVVSAAEDGVRDDSAAGHRLSAFRRRAE